MEKVKNGGGVKQRIRGMPQGTKTGKNYGKQ